MRWIVIVAVLGLVGFAARDAAAEDTYAAIAFSQGSGAHGYGYKAHSREAAEEKALQECGRGCRVVVWVRNSCAALAVGHGNGFGFAYSTDEDAVVTSALRQCNDQTSDCEVRRMVCSAY